MGRGQKGKIAPSEWPTIVARYSRGESLASLARNYGCTGPAIRYIVNRVNSAEGTGLHSDPHDADAKPAVARQTTGNGQAGPPGEAIDPKIRSRVSSDLAAFLVAFDAASEELTATTGAELMGATDKLLRAGARVRIELERIFGDRLD